MPIKIKFSFLKNRIIRIERYKVMLFLYLIFIGWNVVSTSLSSDMSFHKLVFGSEKKYIALTFDDGPHPLYTESIIRLLKENNVRATFFLVGKMCMKYPDLVKKLYESGQELGNHTFSHIPMTDLSDEAVLSEVRLTNKIIEEITGEIPVFLRPPGGNINPHIVDFLNRNKTGLVLWTANPGDYRLIPYKDIIEITLSQCSDGGVILLHSGLYNTLSALPALLDKLKSENYEICPVSELFSRRISARYKNINSYIKMPVD